MTVERRLSKTRKAVALALYEKGQRLQQEIQEINGGLDELVESWANKLGLDLETLDCQIQGKGDGELYVTCTPKPQDMADEELAAIDADEMEAAERVLESEAEEADAEPIAEAA